MKKESLLNGRVLTMSYFHDGEEVTISQSVDAEAFRKFLNEHTNEDAEVLLEDMENADFKLEFKTVTVEENRESEIQGLMWGDGISREEAIKQIETTV